MMGITIAGCPASAYVFGGSRNLFGGCQPRRARGVKREGGSGLPSRVSERPQHGSRLRHLGLTGQVFGPRPPRAARPQRQGPRDDGGARHDAPPGERRGYGSALALLLRTTPTHSVNAGSKPPQRHTVPLAQTGSPSKSKPPLSPSVRAGTLSGEPRRRWRTLAKSQGSVIVEEVASGARPSADLVL